MKKFLISEEEKSNILSMHKQLIKEQTQQVDILRKAIAGGCLRNGQLVQSKVDPSKYIYRAKTDNGTDIDFYGDMTYKLRVSGQTGKWKLCPGALQIDANAAAAAETKKDDDAKIASLKKQNYKTKEELMAAGVDLNTLDKVYDKVTVGQINLYRPKGQSADVVLGTGTQQFNDEQKAFINQYDAKGYVIPGGQGFDRTKVNSYKAVTAKQLGAPDDLFPNGLTLYYDPAKQSNVQSDQSLVSDLLKNQSVDREACRKNVEDYYKSFKRDITIDPATLYKVKAVVQACKNEYYNKWGILGGGKKLDNYLDIMSGDKEGGPLSYGDNAIWRLK